MMAFRLLSGILTNTLCITYLNILERWLAPSREPPLHKKQRFL